MIILLTGPSGSGKTDVSWALLSKSKPMTFLDCDWFASRSPFSWAHQADLESVFQALSLMIDFHLKVKRVNFVITLTLEMAEHFQDYSHYLKNAGLPMQGFRLRCDEAVLKERILMRDRIRWQKKAELKNMRAAQKKFDDLFPDHSFFYRIDTTHQTLDEVADTILNKLALSQDYLNLND